MKPLFRPCQAEQTSASKSGRAAVKPAKPAKRKVKVKKGKGKASSVQNRPKSSQNPMKFRCFFSLVFDVFC